MSSDGIGAIASFSSIHVGIFKEVFILFILKLNLNMTKTITIRDEVYEKLRMLKGDVSLSDFIERLIGGGKGIEVLKKIRETIELNSEEKETILKEIYRKRDEKRDFNDCLRY